MNEGFEYNSQHSLQTPVLFLIFNRPDTTKQVFEAIRKARPPRLYIAADGPRAYNNNEDEIVKSVRQYVLDSIDWDCEIKTLFREENLGCKRAVSEAITWFFDQEEAGVILEDDCVPDQSFFFFCQNLLEKYRDDERIMMISGMNYLYDNVEIIESYFFSRYYPIWGWATWKRAWSLYDITMADWPEFNSQKFLFHLFNHTKIARYFQDMFQKAYLNRIDTWDIQWAYSCLINYCLAICPKYNLISNIGYAGTHSENKSKFQSMPVKSLNCATIIHPRHIIPNIILDQLIFDKITNYVTISKRIFRLIKFEKKK